MNDNNIENKEQKERELISDATSGEYKYGFTSDIDTDIIPPGLSEDVIRHISAVKGEPAISNERLLSIIT